MPPDEVCRYGVHDAAEPVRHSGWISARDDVAAFYMRAADVRRKRDPVVYCVTFAVVHTVYFPAVRYRMPMEFVLLVYHAAGLDALARRRTRWGSVAHV